MREVTEGRFEQDVLQAEHPVVVDFWAPWCGPCHAVEPVFERLADGARGRVEFVKVNVDLNPAIAAKYGVLALPTAILFENGEPRETVLGARSASHYERVWARWLTPAEPLAQRRREPRARL